MASLDEDFEARMNRVRAKSRNFAPATEPRHAGGSDVDERAVITTILRPQLALVLGAIALILGRAIAIHQLGVEPNPELLSLTEGIAVLPFLVMIGLAIGRSHVISHLAMVVGATLSFMLEGYYIPLAPGLMEMIYDPDYVSIVYLNAL